MQFPFFFRPKTGVRRFLGGYRKLRGKREVYRKLERRGVHSLARISPGVMADKTTDNLFNTDEARHVQDHLNIILSES